MWCGCGSTSSRESFLLPVNRLRGYTGIRCLRIEEWSADSGMKEMKNKTIRVWIKKHKRQVVLYSGLILIAVPLIIYGLSEISLLPVTGGNDWAGFWGGYFGAIIGGICTVGGVFLSIQYEREKDKDDAERAVLPYIALTTLEKENRVDCFHLKTIDDVDDDEPDGYNEFLLDRLYFIIKGEEITLKRKLTKEQRLLLENEGNSWDEIFKGGRALVHQKIMSVPILLTNVGNGAAICFRLGFHSSNTQYNDKGVKYTVPKHLEKENKFYLNLYFEDLSDYTESKEFVLRVLYENIYTQKYLQEYSVWIVKDEGVKIKIDLTHRQKKL